MNCLLKYINQQELKIFSIENLKNSNTIRIFLMRRENLEIWASVEYYFTEIQELVLDFIVLNFDSKFRILLNQIRKKQSLSIKFIINAL